MCLDGVNLFGENQEANTCGLLPLQSGNGKSGIEHCEQQLFDGFLVTVFKTCAAVSYVGIYLGQKVHLGAILIGIIGKT